MSAHTKKHPISAHAHGATLHITHHTKTYAIPKKIAEQYVIEDKKKKLPKSSITIKKLFDQLDKKFTKAGALLKGLRLREGLSQVQFAKKINVNQANLSSMENGRRLIGKVIAKRIQKLFGTDYRYFL
jgi:ribosome-binding protein aMBF1 (putative translation factor)